MFLVNNRQPLKRRWTTSDRSPVQLRQNQLKPSNIKTDITGSNLETPANPRCMMTVRGNWTTLEKNLRGEDANYTQKD